MLFKSEDIIGWGTCMELTDSLVACREPKVRELLTLFA